MSLLQNNHGGTCYGTKDKFFHQLLIQKEWRVIKEELGKLSPQLITRLLKEISPADKILFFRLLPRIQAKETFECMTKRRTERNRQRARFL